MQLEKSSDNWQNRLLTALPATGTVALAPVHLEDVIELSGPDTTVLPDPETFPYVLGTYANSKMHIRDQSHPARTYCRWQWSVHERAFPQPISRAHHCARDAPVALPTQGRLRRLLRARALPTQRRSETRLSGGTVGSPQDGACAPGGPACVDPRSTRLSQLGKSPGYASVPHLCFDVTHLHRMH